MRVKERGQKINLLLQTNQVAAILLLIYLTLHADWQVCMCIAKYYI